VLCVGVKIESFIFESDYTNTDARLLFHQHECFVLFAQTKSLTTAVKKFAAKTSARHDKIKRRVQLLGRASTTDVWSSSNRIEIAQRMKKKICLNMIVKNESKVIERCLESVRPYVDAWVIVDTGSSDDTIEKIRRSLKDLPGALHQRQWRNFGANRTEAAALAYEANCDYLLFMDADDTLMAPKSFQWPELTQDAYELWLQYGGYRYTRQMLVSTRMLWRWIGVVHEYPEAFPMAQTFGRLEEPQVRSSTEGARSSDPQKYQRDAELLLQGLRDEPNNTRYLFYLAQSYRDSADFEKAIETYTRRIAAGGWDEEVWRSKLEIARLKEKTNAPHAEIHQSFLEAYDARPTRAEPLVDLARICRARNQFHAAYLYAKHAATIPTPNDRLFVEAIAYSFGALDELSIAAYWTNRFSECKDICLKLLESGAIPPEHVDRVKANLQFAQQKLGR
jgi:tetratricopeptide (TPR) repeat protein